MALAPTSKLEAVNGCLTNIGESPVADLTTGLLVGAKIAEDVVDEISRDLQMDGWHFNTEVRRLSPDVSGNLHVPANTLKIDSTGYDTSRDVIQRGTKLYDKSANTFTFTSGITVEMVLGLEWDELPEVARRLIAVRAARVFQERQLGVDSVSQQNRDDERRAWVSFNHAEGQSADYNILNTSLSAKIARRV